MTGSCLTKAQSPCTMRTTTQPKVDRTMDRIFTWVAERVASLAGQPVAFVVSLGTVIVWAATGPWFNYSTTWQLVINTGTTIVTFLMVFLIQNTTNRDGGAIQAKLDELIRASEGARDEFIGIEHLTDRDIKRILEKLERECGSSADSRSKAASVARLQDRY